MGNSTYNQFLYSKVKMLTMLQGDITIGASGAVSSFNTANQVAGVTRLGTGLYQLQMIENFNFFIGGNVLLQSPPIGGSIADGSFVVGTLYQITIVGTTNWFNVGLNAGLTPAVGQTFVATAVGGAGTGTAHVIGNTGIVNTEIAQNAQNSLRTSTTNAGALLIMQTFGLAAGPTTALANPTSGSIIRFMLYFRNSSVVY